MLPLLPTGMSACIDDTLYLTVKTRYEEMRRPGNLLETIKNKSKASVRLSPVLVDGTNGRVVFKDMASRQIPVKPRPPDQSEIRLFKQRKNKD